MTIKDSNGKKLGEIKERGSKQVAYDASGRKIGEYDVVLNITKDAHGKRIGQGNLLAHML